MNENSFLYKLDPRTKILLMLGFIVVGVSILDPFITLVIMLVVLLLYKLAGIPGEKVVEITKPLIFAFIMFFLLNFPFAQPLPGEKVFFYLIPPKSVPITMTGILTGFGNALRFVMFIWIANLITNITPTSDLLLALNKSNVSPEISIAIGIAFSYIPELQKEFSTIVEAQKSRGAQLEFRNPLRKIIAYVPIIVPALFISLLRGRDIASAIEARGFTYNPRHRTYRRQIDFDIKDYIVISLIIIIAALVLFLKYRYDWFDYHFVFNLIANSK